MKSSSPFPAMMMVVMVCVSASPLPAPPETSREAEPNTRSLPQLMKGEERNSTWPHLNQTVHSWDTQRNGSTFMMNLPQEDPKSSQSSTEITPAGACFLPTCPIHNLSNDLQKGDEKAGDLTRDPYGNGKK